MVIEYSLHGNLYNSCKSADVVLLISSPFVEVRKASNCQMVRVYQVRRHVNYLSSLQES
jgi:hypothetical protein